MKEKELWIDEWIWKYCWKSVKLLHPVILFFLVFWKLKSQFVLKLFICWPNFLSVSEEWLTMLTFLSLCRLSPGINELVKKLRANNTSVYLISGGFRQMINVCSWTNNVLFVSFVHSSERVFFFNYFQVSLKKYLVHKVLLADDLKDAKICPFQIWFNMCSKWT